MGRLVELLPPGPSPLVVAQPRKLFEYESVRLLFRTLVEAEDERAFVERTGIDPRRVDELVVFELGNAGYVALVRGEFAARDVVERGAARLVLLDVQTDEPVLRREGPSSTARYAYAELDAHAVLVAKNAPPQLVAAILARRTDRALPRVFDDEDAAALYRTYGAAACALFAPRPLLLEPNSGAAVLLVRERALAVTAQPADDSFHITVDIRGTFPQGAEENFRRLVVSVAASPLGQLLGLGDVSTELKVVQSAQAIQLTFPWSAQRLSLGLRTLFMDDLRDLLR